jgi:hypothetical protein
LDYVNSAAVTDTAHLGHALARRWAILYRLRLPPEQMAVRYITKTTRILARVALRAIMDIVLRRLVGLVDCSVNTGACWANWCAAGGARSG